jgi:hypothetical protein
MKLLVFSLLVAFCLAFPRSGKADDHVSQNIAELVRSYTYLLITYSPQFNPLAENCSGWEKDLCTIQQQLGKYPEDLETGFGFTKHIAYIPEANEQSISSGQTCLSDCSNKNTLYLSSPQRTLGGGIIAVLSATGPWRTWILLIQPDLTIKIIYNSYDKSTWSEIQPREQIGNVMNVQISGSKLHLVQDEGPGHSHEHTEYLLSLDSLRPVQKPQP